jgi:hypothetical protein
MLCSKTLGSWKRLTKTASLCHDPVGGMPQKDRALEVECRI